MRCHHLVKCAAPLVVLALSACSDSSSPNLQPVSLSFSSQAVAAPSAGDRAGFDVTVTVGANTIVITKAQIVARKIQLESSAAACPDDEHQTGGEDCAELKLGPMLVDLPLTASATTAITAAVPEGTYSEVKFQIHKPTSTPADQTFVSANPDFANASIRIEGLYNGQPFVFTSSMTDVIELEFDPPVVIDAANQNVTVQVDLSSWFMVNGVLVNPTTANTGGANETAVRNNIRASLRAFEDEDKDGDDDGE